MDKGLILKISLILEKMLCAKGVMPRPGVIAHLQPGEGVSAQGKNGGWAQAAGVVLGDQGDMGMLLLALLPGCGGQGKAAPGPRCQQ